MKEQFATAFDEPGCEVTAARRRAGQDQQQIHRRIGQGLLDGRGELLWIVGLGRKPLRLGIP